MNNSEGHHDMSETFQEFIESSLKGIGSGGKGTFNAVGSFNGFFEHPFYYCLVRVWNNLLCDNKDVRLTVSKMLADNYEEDNSGPNGCYYMMQVLYKTY